MYVSPDNMDELSYSHNPDNLVNDSSSKKNLQASVGRLSLPEDLR